MGTAFVFSGQGAQFVGMGKDLHERSDAARTVFANADKILGWSISDLCFSGPEEKLTESRYCQPAIYTVSMACLAAFRAERKSVTPVGCAGLSLGEYAALAAAGALTFEDGLRLIARRGELMDAACRETQGSMASVLGGDLAVIREVCGACGIDVANLNSPGQVVISGHAAGIDQAVAMLKEKGLRKVIPLKVAGAYHSRLMAGAGEKLGTVLAATPFSTPGIPVVQNVTGRETSDPEQIRKNLRDQVAGSVLWEDCVRRLKELGAGHVVEFGPGSILSGLVKRIDKDLNTCNVGKFDDLESLPAF
jgi:[acyl-carrier-protein] S-malonyltransferase